MVGHVLDQLKKKRDLSPEEMSSAMEEIVAGKAGDGDIETFLLLLREKGETASEIASAAKVMRRHAVRLSRVYPGLLDTCGTGGDNQRTFNVSTLSALAACACGATVGKHGNRSVSSLCGSADLLEMLGVKIDLAPVEIERSLEKTAFGFFFAPLFHPAAKFAAAARKRISGKTLFNVLGPLSNPAGASHQLVGVYEERLVRILAEVLRELGAHKAMIVHGKEGLDEISISGETAVAALTAGRIEFHTIRPEDFGLNRSPLESLRCDSKEKSHAEALKVLKGEKSSRADIVSLNAGAALFVAEKAASIQEGVAMAQEALRSGRAFTKLEEIVAQ
jgi:anthranilate phosphoribosyltransferase